MRAAEELNTLSEKLSQNQIGTTDVPKKIPRTFLETPNIRTSKQSTITNYDNYLVLLKYEKMAYNVDYKGIYL